MATITTLEPLPLALSTGNESLQLFELSLKFQRRHPCRIREGHGLRQRVVGRFEGALKDDSP